jgi:hypothetical protein
MVENCWRDNQAGVAVAKNLSKVALKNSSIRWSYCTESKKFISVQILMGESVSADEERT